MLLADYGVTLKSPEVICSEIVPFFLKTMTKSIRGMMIFKLF